MRLRRLRRAPGEARVTKRRSAHSIDPALLTSPDSVSDSSFDAGRRGGRVRLLPTSSSSHSLTECRSVFSSVRFIGARDGAAARASRVIARNFA